MQIRRLGKGKVYGKASKILVLIKGIFNHETPVRVDLILAHTEGTPTPGKGQSAALKTEEEARRSQIPCPTMLGLTMFPVSLIMDIFSFPL